MKIDLHTHILPKIWPDLAAQAKGGEKPFREVPDICWDVKRRVEEMDKDGIDLQVLSTVPETFHYEAKAEDAHSLAKLLNAHLAASVGMAPKRFTALATLPMQDPGFAVKELERCVKFMGFIGVQIGAHVGGRSLSEPVFFPVFEAAAEAGAAVLVHGRAEESARAITALVTGKVLERLPNLRIAFTYGGGDFPREHAGGFYVDSLVKDVEALKNLVALVGAEKVAFGSGFLFPEGEVAAGKLISELPDFDAGTRDRILSATALEFLNLNPDSYQ